jgi:hypothetical protein
MRYSDTPAWVYIMPVGLGISFALGAVGLIVFGPPDVGRPIGVIWLLMDVGFVILSLRALRSRKDEEKIRQDGVHATATLLGAKTTGSHLNGVPQWTFRVRVDGNGPPYETTLKVLTYSPAENGASLEVRVDPQRKDHVVLAGVDGAVPVTSPAPEAAAQAGQSRVKATVNPDGSVTYTSI